MGQQIDIIGIGLACLDILVRTSELPTWEKGVRLSQLAIEGGGPVATGLVAAQRLGAHTAMIATYGNDRLGAIKLQTLTENGVDIRHMALRPGPENQVVLVAVKEETGDRIFSGFMDSENLPITPAELDYDFVTSAKLLHLDGCNPDAAIEAAQWMRRLGKPVMLDGSSTTDPIPTSMKHLVSLADVLICGAGFGSALTGEKDLLRAAEAMRKMGPGIVVQTEGKDGCYTLTREEFFHTPAFQVNVLDTTGAGDVFHGAYLVGLLHGWSPLQNALFSSAVAALKCTQLSGRRGIPNFEQTMAFLNNHGIDLIHLEKTKQQNSYHK
jgi:sugar/nucleoside kinase (ribokinase family)